MLRQKVESHLKSDPRSVHVVARAAARYLNQGWQPVRLRQGSKIAFERDWPRLQRKASDFQIGDNIGLRFGAESSGLVDIDLDFAQARKLIGRPAFGLSHLPEFGRESQAPCQRGHRLVRCLDVADRHQVFGFRGRSVADGLKARGLRQTVIEIRASNTTQSAVPPSRIVDADGTQDKLVWSDGLPPADLPDMSWSVLVRQVGLLAFASFAGAAGMDRPPNAFARHFYGALREAKVSVATAVSIVWEVERLIGGKGDSDPEGTYDNEDLTSFLDFVDFADAGNAIRTWLGLAATSTAVASHAAGTAAAISAEDLEALLEVLDPCDFASYDAWRDLMFASHSSTGGTEAGREVFVDWSARNPDYSELDWQEKVRSSWRRTKASRASKIGVGTLLKQVIDAGHRDLVRQVMRKYDQFGDQEPIDDAPIRELDRSELDAAPILDELPGTQGI